VDPLALFNAVLEVVEGQITVLAVIGTQVSPDGDGDISLAIKFRD
jgi:hypothetical protein